MPTLEVPLVNNSLPDTYTNERADYLAERTQQGSGNSPDGKTAAALRGQRRGDDAGRSRGRRRDAGARRVRSGGDGELLTGRGGSTRFVAASADADAAPATLPQESFAGASFPFAGSDPDAELALKGAPRRELVVTPNTRIVRSRDLPRLMEAPHRAGRHDQLSRTPRGAASSPAIR